MDLCLAEKRRLVPRLAKRWWEQEGLDLEGMLMSAQEEEQTGGTDGMEGTDGTETATEE